MAVRMMVSKERAGDPGVERVDDYSGHETGRVSHGGGCPLAGTFDMSGVLSPGCAASYDEAKTKFGPNGSPCTVYGPLFLETTYAGAVLATGERNGYDDSDFTAMVWDAAKGAPETFVYATTRGWTYPNSAAVDATPEVLAAYEAWAEAGRKARAAARVALLASLPTFGKKVRVVRGRKVKIGTEAAVFWSGPDKFARGARSPFGPSERDLHARVGLRLLDGTKVFTAATNVEVIPEEAR